MQFNAGFKGITQRGGLLLAQAMCTALASICNGKAITDVWPGKTAK